MNRDNVRQLLVIVALLAMIAINALSTALPLNGQTPAEISDRAKVFFVPAGYVFSIWGLIYLGTLAYAIYQALPSNAENRELAGIGTLFVFSSLANITWIFLWHYEYFTLSVPVMLALLGSLIAIYLRLGVGRERVGPARQWLVHMPFRIYLGWITVATIANITAWLYFQGWDGWGIAPETWTWIMLAAAVIIGGIVSLTRGDVAYAAVLIWAFAGIAVKHQDTATVATAAWLAAALTAVLLVTGALRRRQQTGRVALGT